MSEERDFFFDEANDTMRGCRRSFDNYGGGFSQDTFGYEEYENGFEESFDPNQYNNVRQQPLYREVRREQEQQFGSVPFQPVSNYGYQIMSPNYYDDDRWMYDPIYVNDFGSGYDYDYGYECGYDYGFGNDDIWWIIIIAIFFFGAWGFCFF